MEVEKITTYWSISLFSMKQQKKTTIFRPIIGRWFYWSTIVCVSYYTLFILGLLEITKFHIILIFLHKLQRYNRRLNSVILLLWIINTNLVFLKQNKAHCYKSHFSWTRYTWYFVTYWTDASNVTFSRSSFKMLFLFSTWNIVCSFWVISRYILLCTCFFALFWQA